MSVLAKIRALVARAKSDHEEEARTSAVQACRLLLEHKIVLSLPGPGVEEKTDEELREAALEYIRRRQAEAQKPVRSSPNVAAQAKARAYAKAYTQHSPFSPPSPEEAHARDVRRAKHTVHTPSKSEGDLPTVTPFDPYEAPFEVVRDYVRARGFELRDLGSGSFSVQTCGARCFGSWSDVIAFCFGLIERGHASVVYR